MALPEDPFILLSFVNTKLRDEYESLEAFCDAYETDKTSLADRLAAFGYKYSFELNRFV